MPVADTKPPVIKLATFALPAIVTKLLVLSNVNAVLELALPPSLNTTPVLEPGITILPEILPTTLPIKLFAVILPVAVRVPLPLVLNVTLADPFPTIKPVNVPVLVMLGCAAVVNVPVKKLADTTLAPVILPPPAPVVTILPALILPVTSKLVSVPTLVTFG